MYYEINVALNGYHYFATAERSLQTEAEARDLYNKFKQAFPEDQGYKMQVTCRKQVGQHIDTGEW